METKSSHRLAKGQIWKLRDGYVYIVEPGKRLVQYKLLRHQAQKGVMTRMVGISQLETYLAEHAAQLVSGVSSN
jgi:hypothetical protein